jgi:hypothetical protein
MMESTSIAIIGTAGRKADGSKLTSDHFDRMVESVGKILTRLHVDMSTSKFISGGAAWADHIPVELVLRGLIPAKNLTLYLPSDIDDNGIYFGTNGKSNSTAGTANYYHRLFSEKLGRKTSEELIKVRNMGAVLVPGTGNFFVRNLEVAKSVSPGGVLIAFTFGHNDSNQGIWSLRIVESTATATHVGLATGGTAHTFNAAKPKYKCHVRLG